jgi:hypothetical protein
VPRPSVVVLPASPVWLVIAAPTRCALQTGQQRGQADAQRVAQNAQPGDTATTHYAQPGDLATTGYTADPGTTGGVQGSRPIR